MKRRAPPRRLPKPAPPDGAAREYYRNVRRYSEALIRKLRRELKALVPDLRDEAAEALEPVVDPEVTRVDSAYSVSKKSPGRTPIYSVSRMDADISKALLKLFEKIGREMKAEFTDDLLSRWGWSMVDQVNRLGKKNIQKVAKAIKVDVEPLLRDDHMNPYFQRVVGENVGLIRSLSDVELPKLKNQLVAMITADAPQDEIADAIQAMFGTTRNRAKLIAVDQVGKLNGKVDEHRQRALGGRRYRWRGALDSRESEEHLRLEGKLCSWDKPPKGGGINGKPGHPKSRPRCRCWAEMVVEDILA